MTTAHITIWVLWVILSIMVWLLAEYNSPRDGLYKTVWVLWNASCIGALVSIAAGVLRLFLWLAGF